jgi:hypothetical protein
MKIAKKTVDKLFTKSGVPNKDVPKHKPPPLTLTVEVQSKDEQDLRKSSQFYLKVNPKDNSKKATKEQYKFTMYHIDGSETLRQTIQWYKDILLVLTGMGIKDAEQMVPLIEQQCEGSAQAAFQTTLNTVSLELLNEVDQQIEAEVGEQQEDETLEDYEERRTEARTTIEKQVKLAKKDVVKCLQKVIEAACPYKVLQKQRKYMRRYMRKPRDMTIRQFVNAVTRMNNDELPYLPPFEANQSLPEDDIIEIVLHACPNSWIQEMDRQDFDSDRHTLPELLQFLERIESLEPTVISHSTKASSVSEHKSNTKRPTGKAKTGKWCEYHKTDSHNTSECRSLEYHKKKESQKGGNNNWKKKADENKTYTRKELNAILTKVMNKEKKTKSKEKPKPERKRKAETELNVMDEIESQSVRSELEETSSFITSTTTSTMRGDKNNIDELLDDLSIESNDS